MKRMVSLILLTLLLCTGIGCGNNSAEAIKVGVIAPLTGPAAGYGVEAANMIKLAVDEINSAGGINGRKIELIEEDGRCDSQTAVNAAQKLIGVDGVKIILGGHCSTETAAIAPILNENKVFGLTGLTSTTGITNDYEYVFRASSTTADLAAHEAKIAYQKYGYHKVAILTAQTSYAQSFVTDFLSAYKQLGGEVVTTEEFASGGNADVRSIITKLKEMNFDALCISSQTSADAVGIIKQLVELNFDRPIFGNGTAVMLQTYKDSGGLLPSNAFTVIPYVDESSPKPAELIDKYQKKYGQNLQYPLSYSGPAYDCVYMLKMALEKCGVDADCIKDYFYTIKDYHGVVTTYSFDEHGDATMFDWREFRVDDGKEVIEKTE
jgi:branched-chain amino acid transport system substrate-binding protein